MRREDLEEPACKGALLEAEMAILGHGPDDLDNSPSVGLHDVGREPLAAGPDDRNGAA